MKYAFIYRRIATRYRSFLDIPVDSFMERTSFRCIMFVGRVDLEVFKQRDNIHCYLLGVFSGEVGFDTCKPLITVFIRLLAALGCKSHMNIGYLSV